MASAGMRPKALQLIMGHSSIEITLNVYTHLEAGDLHEAMEEAYGNKQYDFYPFTRVPEHVSIDDDYEEGEADMYEEADDDVA